MQEKFDTLEGQFLTKMPIPGFQIDLDGRIIFANPACHRVFPSPLIEGCDRLDNWGFVGVDLKRIVPAMLSWRRAIELKQPIENYKYGIQTNGYVKWYWVSSAPLEDDEQHIIGAIVNFWSVPERANDQVSDHDIVEDTSGDHFIDDELLQSLQPFLGETRYKSLLEEAPFAIEVYNSDGILIDANLAWQKLWEMRVENSIGKLNVFESEHIQQLNLFGHIEEAYKGEKAQLPHIEYVSKIGLRKIVRCNYYPIKDDKCKVLNVVIITEDITEKVRAEKILKESEVSDESLLNSLPEAIALTDEQANIHKMNHGWVQLALTIPLFESLGPGKNFLAEIYSDRSHPKLFEVYDKTEEVLSGCLEKYETELNYPEHSQSWYTLRVVPISFPLKGSVVSFLDISHKKRVERALENSLVKYRNIYNRTPIMLHSLNQFDAMISVSDFWLEKMGYERSEVIGKLFTDFLHPDSLPVLHANNEKFREQGFLKDQQLQVITKEGEVIDVMHSCISELDKNGNFVRSLDVLVDVSEMKRIEQQLQRSKEYVDEAQRIAEVGNFELDIVTGELEASDLLREMYHVAPGEELTFEALKNALHPDFKKLISKSLYETIVTGEDFEREFEILPEHSKTPVWVTGKGKVRRDKDGLPRYLRGTIQDITERKKNELKLQAMRERLEIAALSSNTGVWEYSFTQSEFIFDDAVCHFLEVEEDVHLTLREWMHLIENPGEIIRQVRGFLQTPDEILRIDYSLVTQSGVQRWIRAFGKLIRDHEGHVVRIIGTMYDNSEDVIYHKTLEKVIDQKNVLLREVHHRVKNNMQMISSILALRSYEMKVDGDKKVIQDCHYRIQSMARVYEHLYQMQDISSIDLDQYLKKIVDEHISQNYDNVVTNRLVSNQLIVSPDQALYCGLIVEELLTNATKHNLQKTKNVSVDIVLRQLENQVHLEVNNDGSPIPGNVLKGGHPGLGIDLIQTLVSEIGGAIWLNDRNGFSVEFPQEMMP